MKIKKFFTKWDDVILPGIIAFMAFLMFPATYLAHSFREKQKDELSVALGADRSTVEFKMDMTGLPHFETKKLLFRKPGESSSAPLHVANLDFGIFHSTVLEVDGKPFKAETSTKER